MDKFYVTDCEGPLSINDNAYELADYFIPEGGKLFSILSSYDDILSQKYEEHLPGSTLKMILPFFKDQDITEKDIVEFSEDNISMINGAYQLIEYVQEIMPTYIVSTSYNQYIKALCNKTKFNYENTYSTNLSLDQYSITSDETDKIIGIRDNILFDPSFENIDHYYKDVIPGYEINSLIESVKPVGGAGKRDAILDIIDKHNYKPENLMYSGDSITDKEALEYAKDNDGISISFNGNIHSIKVADISIASDSNLILALIGSIFNSGTKSRVYDFIDSYNDDPLDAILSYSDNDSPILQDLLLNVASIDIVREDNIDQLKNKAEEMRNKVRGIKIANLG
ncbi:MAG: hypothetical protein LUG89_03150 [Methanosphaera sp.]|nr:hypothetical protein [Methanosphaera sp.]